jgi:hypothetical protein
MTEWSRTNPGSFRARHRGPGYVIPDLIRDRDDGPGVHVERLKVARNFQFPVSKCHSEERSDEESPRVLHRLPPYSQLQIPHCVLNDTGVRRSE